MRFIGIDLAWVARNRTGLAAVIDGRIVDSTTVITDDEICAWLAPHLRGPALVAVDAPLIVRNAAGTSRPCDRAITAVFGGSHAGAHAANLGIASFANGVRAERLAKRLGLGTDPSFSPGEPVSRMIEVYPHPAIVSLFGLRFSLKYKAKRGRALADRKAAFAELIGHLTALDAENPQLCVESAPRWRLLCDCVEMAASDRQLDLPEDELDAFVCAYIGLYYWKHGTSRCRVVGNLDSGDIVTPVTQESGDRIDRLVLRELPPVDTSTTAIGVTPVNRAMPVDTTAIPFAASARAGSALCACGCGATVNRRYRPGHDARHKEALIRRALDGDTAAEMTLASLGWAEFLDARERSRDGRQS